MLPRARPPSGLLLCMLRYLALRPWPSNGSAPNQRVRSRHRPFLPAGRSYHRKQAVSD